MYSTIVIFDKVPLTKSNNEDKSAIDISLNKPLEDTSEFTNIPNKFIDRKSWPKKCNLECGLSGLKLQTVPMFVPIVKNQDTYIRSTYEPIFLIPGCAIRWILDQNWTDEVRHKRYSLFMELMVDMFGYSEDKIGLIPPVPAKGMMKKYGGTLTEADYWERVEDTNYESIKMIYSSKKLMHEDSERINLYGRR